MNEITSKAVEDYFYGLLPARDEVLRAMEDQASKRDIPIVGPAVARVFFQLASMIEARSVFEMGSAIGYSTLWWAMAGGEGGRVVYTDSSQKNADEARRSFERAGVAERIDIRIGDALEILSEEKPASYDIVFNDIDKEDYPRALKLAATRVRRGGLFITDNVLWSGRVAQPSASQDPSTRGIVEFNKALYQHQEFFTTILPLRDGVAVALRL